MNIGIYDKDITSDMMTLLLSADPDEKAVLSYLPDSKVLVCIDKGVILGMAVLTETAGVFELKNIAVLEEHQGKGIGKALIFRVKKLAKESGAKTLEVGTGNSSLHQLALYQKCGFRMHNIKSGYFNSYPEPIFENGIRCIDMVRLRADLQ